MFTARLSNGSSINSDSTIDNVIVTPQSWCVQELEVEVEVALPSTAGTSVNDASVPCLLHLFTVESLFVVAL